MRWCDGGRVWTVAVPLSAPRWTVHVGDTVLTGDALSTTAIDRPTGARRWTVQGTFLWASHKVGRAATIQQEPPSPGSAPKPGVITIVDLVSGAVQWSAQIDRAADHIVVLDRQGRRDVVGLLVDGRHLPFDTLVPRDLPPLPEHASVSFVDDMVLVTDAGRGKAPVPTTHIACRAPTDQISVWGYAR